MNDIPKPSDGMARNFQIRCPKCRWARSSTGTKDDLADLREMKNNCSNCGKIRKFQCPKCGNQNSKMIRIQGNAPITPKPEV